MYSSLYEAFVREPEAMVVPVDDHIVHRGDGIFEALRFHGRRIFAFAAHVDRLLKSADLVSMKMPCDRARLTALCQEIVDASPAADGILRIFISRGPGDFSPNPYSTLGAVLTLVTMPFKNMPAEMYERGASAVFSKVPAKQGLFAQVKSCNYLPNVLTKKEAIDRGADFAVNVTADGFVAEGPTENIMLLSAQGELLAPAFDYTLRGTTLLRVFEMAQTRMQELGVRAVSFRNLHVDDFYAAREVMMVGTTLGVLPVTRIEGRAVGVNGKVGAVAKALNGWLEKEMGI
jgi:branched-chain amino acid aminotransferase